MLASTSIFSPLPTTTPAGLLSRRVLARRSGIGAAGLSSLGWRLFLGLAVCLLLGVCAPSWAQVEESEPQPTLEAPPQPLPDALASPTVPQQQPPRSDSEAAPQSPAPAETTATPQADTVSAAADDSALSPDPVLQDTTAAPGTAATPQAPDTSSIPPAPPQPLPDAPASPTVPQQQAQAAPKPPPAADTPGRQADSAHPHSESSPPAAPRWPARTHWRQGALVGRNLPAALSEWRLALSLQGVWRRGNGAAVWLPFTAQAQASWQLELQWWLPPHWLAEDVLPTDTTPETPQPRVLALADSPPHNLASRLDQLPDSLLLWLELVVGGAEVRLNQQLVAQWRELQQGVVLALPRASFLPGWNKLAIRLKPAQEGFWPTDWLGIPAQIGLLAPQEAFTARDSTAGAQNWRPPLAPPNPAAPPIRGAAVHQRAAILYVADARWGAYPPYAELLKLCRTAQAAGYSALEVQPPPPAAWIGNLLQAGVPLRRLALSQAEVVLCTQSAHLPVDLRAHPRVLLQPAEGDWRVGPVATEQLAWPLTLALGLPFGLLGAMRWARLRVANHLFDLPLMDRKVLSAIVDMRRMSPAGLALYLAYRTCLVGSLFLLACQLVQHTPSAHRWVLQQAADTLLGSLYGQAQGDALHQLGLGVLVGVCWVMWEGLVGQVLERLYQVHRLTRIQWELHSTGAGYLLALQPLLLFLALRLAALPTAWAVGLVLALLALEAVRSANLQFRLFELHYATPVFFRLCYICVVQLIPILFLIF